MERGWEMRLELAVTGDLEALESLYKRAINKMESEGIFQWDELYPSRGVLEEDAEKGQLLKITENGETLGAVALNQDEDPEYETNGNWICKGKDFMVVHRLCVDSLHQGKGVGAGALGLIHEKCGREGCKAIRLDAFSKNPIALRMYEKLGYQKVGEAVWRTGRFFLLEKAL
jgi:GNAT superfamily N-acetyltransferase